jgi:hypothetical protein
MVKRWKYFRSAKEAKEFLADLLNNHFRRYMHWDGDHLSVERLSVLTVNIDEFEEKYYGFRTGESSLIGYIAINYDSDIRVKAVVAEGINDVWVEMIDIEEWLDEHRYDDDFDP